MLTYSFKLIEEEIHFLLEDDDRHSNRTVAVVPIYGISFLFNRFYNLHGGGFITPRFEHMLVLEKAKLMVFIDQAGGMQKGELSNPSTPCIPRKGACDMKFYFKLATNMVYFKTSGMVTSVGVWEPSVEELYRRFTGGKINKDLAMTPTERDSFIRFQLLLPGEKNIRGPLFDSFFLAYINTRNILIS